MDHKEFFVKSCFLGACVGGLGHRAFGIIDSENPIPSGYSQDDSNTFHSEWIATLLSNLSSQLSPGQMRGLVKKNAHAHYANLQMDVMLQPYIGKPDDFLAFISGKWGWKVDYDRVSGVIVADEGKSYCVCPLVNMSKKPVADAICYCSEGFAELMFSVVFGKPLIATVVSSVIRGDSSCRYRIDFE